MSKSDFFDEIEAYLTGQLSNVEKEAFEKQLAENEALALAYELQKLEHQSMEVLVENDLRRRMTSWTDAPPVNPFESEEGAGPTATIPPITKQHEEETKVIPISGNRFRFLWLAAAIAGLAIVAYAVNQYLAEGTDARRKMVDEKTDEVDTNIAPIDTTQPPSPSITPPETPKTAPPKAPSKPIRKTIPKSTQPPSNTLLAIATYTEDLGGMPPFTSNLKSSTAQTDSSAVFQAAEAFDRGDYQTAIGFLGETKPGDQSHVRYLRGHTYFNLKSYQKAISEFSYIAADEFLPNYEESRWYLLLSYLATYQDNAAAFKELGSDLAQDEYSSYQERTAQLLKKVK